VLRFWEMEEKSPPVVTIFSGSMATKLILKTRWSC